jgi:hypothetical protein
LDLWEAVNALIISQTSGLFIEGIFDPIVEAIHTSTGRGRNSECTGMMLYVVDTALYAR